MFQLPALYLHPVNGSFAPKRLSLADGVHVALARDLCDTPDTVPTRDNGRFASMVLSRQHAEVWAEGSTVRLPISALSACMCMS